MIKQIRVSNETHSLIFLLQEDIRRKTDKFHSMDHAIRFLLDYYKKDSKIINEALNGIYQIEEFQQFGEK